MTKTIVGLYDNFNDAQHAVQDLVDNGFRRDDISLVANNATGEFDQYDTNRDRDRHTRTDEDDISPTEGAGIGAGIGGAIGGIGGLLMGIGLLAIPGVGPALAAGPIVSMLVGAGIGAATGGVAGALVNMGVPEEEAGYYAEGVRRGSTLVNISVPDERANDAANIMSHHNPIDIDRRAASWREQGWTGYDHTAQPYNKDQIRQEHERYRTLETQGGEAAIPVIEEEMQVGKRQVQRGGARVHTYVSEHPVQEQVRLREEHVDVERRPVNRPVNDADRAAFQEGSFEVTETSEQAVVQKSARVIEEVLIHKDVGERTETVSDTVRRTEVDVDQTGSARAVGQTPFRAEDFRSRYNSKLGQSGYSYEEIVPVYQYGYGLGSDSRYSNRKWSQVEPEAHRMWEERNPGTWEQFKGEIQHAWDKARGHR